MLLIECCPLSHARRWLSAARRMRPQLGGVTSILRQRRHSSKAPKPLHSRCALRPHLAVGYHRSIEVDGSSIRVSHQSHNLAYYARRPTTRKRQEPRSRNLHLHLHAPFFSSAPNSAPRLSLHNSKSIPKEKTNTKQNKTQQWPQSGQSPSALSVAS